MKIIKVTSDGKAVIFPTLKAAASDASMNRNTFSKQIRLTGRIYVDVVGSFYYIPTIITDK